MGRGSGISASGKSLLFGTRTPAAGTNSAAEREHQREIVIKEAIDFVSRIKHPNDELNPPSAFYVRPEMIKNGTTKIEFIEDMVLATAGTELRAWFNQDGELHHETEPALVRPGLEQWFRNGTRHREDGPAVTGADEEKWFVDGEYHREQGPAVTYKDKGVVVYQIWMQKGVNHRLEGPSTIRYDLDENITSTKYYVAGEPTTKRRLKWAAMRYQRKLASDARLEMNRLMSGLGG